MALPPPLAARLAHVKSSPVRDILALTEREDVISFAGGLPAPELFDNAGLRAAFAHALADERAGRSLQYSTSEGDPRLRAWIAQRLSVRGLATKPGQVLVTSGSQQALTLAATVLIEPGDAVLVEEPSYLAALQCFGLAGARLIPDALPELIRRERPKLLYTIPTFQNPTGRTLELGRRQAIADCAQHHGLWIVEDDPYGELRYRGEPPTAIASLPGAEDRTLALSTLSKVAAPGLRLGWVRAPRELLTQLTIAKQAADLHSSTVDQAAAAQWLHGIDLDGHLAHLRRVYGERRDTLLGGLERTLPEGSTWSTPDGGMFVWVQLPEGHDAEALLVAALEHDVAFVPGYPFFCGPPDRATLRLSFTTHTPAEIADGLERLGAGVRVTAAV
jgi:2-aminoadipate transaminase